MKTAILAATMASFVLLASSWLPADAVVNGTRSDDPSVASATVRFAVIGDFGMGNYSDPALSQPEADVAIQVASWNPDFIVTTGDDNYPDGTAETIDANIGKDYHDFIYPYFGIYGTGADINRFFPTLGNHDWRTVDAEGMPYPYLNFFTLPENGRQELYYHFTWGPVQFFMLDSDISEPDGNYAKPTLSIQAQWLHNGLTASTSPWQLVLMHHAPFSSGTGHGSVADMQWPYKEWGADAVLAGHDHTYERIMKDGLPYFVNGIGGAGRYYFITPPVTGSMVRYRDDWGAMLVQASDLQMTYQFITRTGLLVDTFVLKKYTNLHSDFDADRSSDISYFHLTPTGFGVWGILQSSTGFTYSDPQYFSWGQTGDIPTPGDFDGDEIIDPAVVIPPAGSQSQAYRILLSGKGYDQAQSKTVPAGWPGLGDTPVVGDFNGDGISDPAIWRGSTGVWIIPLSPTFTSYRFRSWGQTGDIPVEGDVDSDGQTDIGYWRPSTGVWGFLLSSQAYAYAVPRFFSWGDAADTPVMADYDGDGKADPAVVIPATGGQSKAYRILLSSKDYDPAQSRTVTAGWPGLQDTPVPGDYDGDGKADAGIWRGSTGVWIVPLSSNNNYLFRAWGASGDQVIR